MKKNCLLLFVALLPFLFGCDDKNEALTPDVYGHITLEYFDKETDIGHFLLEGQDKIDAYAKEPAILVEILSFTENGESISTGRDDTFLVRDIISFSTEPFSNDDMLQPMVRHYTLRYRVPSIRGESIEEINLTHHVNIDGYFKGFVEAWYNGKAISIVGSTAYEDAENNPYNDEELKLQVKERLYNGSLVADVSEFNIYIVIPVEKP